MKEMCSARARACVRACVRDMNLWLVICIINT